MSKRGRGSAEWSAKQAIFKELTSRHAQGTGCGVVLLLTHFKERAVVEFGLRIVVPDLTPADQTRRQERPR